MCLLNIESPSRKDLILFAKLKSPTLQLNYSFRFLYGFKLSSHLLSRAPPSMRYVFDTLPILASAFVCINSHYSAQNLSPGKREEPAPIRREKEGVHRQTRPHTALSPRRTWTPRWRGRTVDTHTCRRSRPQTTAASLYPSVKCLNCGGLPYIHTTRVRSQMSLSLHGALSKSHGLSVLSVPLPASKSLTFSTSWAATDQSANEIALCKYTQIHCPMKSPL